MNEPVRHYSIRTDYGVMVFTSNDVLGYWWELITGVKHDAAGEAVLRIAQGKVQ